MDSSLRSLSPPKNGNVEMRANRILGRLSANTLERLRPNLEEMSVEAGQILFTPLSTTPYFYFPTSAVLSHLSISATGSSIEIAMVGSEGMSSLGTGMDKLGPICHGFVCSGGTVVRIAPDKLRNQVSEDGPFASVILEYLQRRVAEAAQRTFCAAFHRTDERLCTWLLMLNDRVPVSSSPVTHEQIANCLGANRTTVSIIAKELRDDGAIDYIRGKLTITDRSRLLANACECYTASAL